MNEIGVVDKLRRENQVTELTSLVRQLARMSAQGNSPSLKDMMKQLATSNLEFQQTMSSNNMQFQQSMNATI
ncbi:hypothetical protein CR513_37875, partial [Mucuna pruriens]